MSKKGGFGVPTSYVKGSQIENVEAMLFMPHHPFMDDVRKHHVHSDHPMNSWGTHLQHIQFLANLARILLPLVEQGALGASEMASGDGNIVATLSAAAVAWREVLVRYHEAGEERAEAARVAAQPPFVVVSSDFNDAELAPKQRHSVDELFGMLTKRSAIMRHFSPYGDITKPEEFASAIEKIIALEGDLQVAENGAGRPIGIRDFVQLMMFAFEERDLQLEGLDPETVADILRRGVVQLEADLPGDPKLQANLRNVLEDLGAILPGDPLPQGPELLNRIRRKLDMASSNYGPLVPAEVVAAEFARFLERFSSLAPMGLMILSVCTTVLGAVDQRQMPQPNVNYWWTHAFREHILTAPQERLLYLIAGYRIEAYVGKPKPELELVNMAHLTSRQKSAVPAADETAVATALKSPLPFIPFIKEGVIDVGDGIQVGYAEYGDPNGTPVIYFAGSQGSRYEVEAYALDQLRNARVIVIERPGIGHSTPMRNYTLVKWQPIVHRFVDGLLGESAKFGVAGYSVGSPFALTLMADKTLSSRILFRVLFSPLGQVLSREQLKKDGYTEEMQRRYGMGLDWQAGDRRLWTFVRRWMNGIMSEAFWRQNYEKFMKGQSAQDQEILNRPWVAAAMKKSWQAAYRLFGPEGWVGDNSAPTGSWWPHLQDIEGPVHLFHSVRDIQVPYHIAQALARALPQGILHEVPGDTHRFIVDIFHTVINELVSKSDLRNARSLTARAA